MKNLLFILLFFLFGISSLAYNQFLPNKDEKFQDYKMISSIINQGIDLVLVDKVEEGFKKFQKALDLAQQKNYDELIPIIVISQSRLYALEDKHKEGLEALLKIGQYFIDQPARPYAGDYYEYVGHTYLKLGELDLAMENLKKSEAIRLKTEPAKNWRTYNGMADIYDLQGKEDLAQEYMVKARRLSKMQNSKKMLDDIKRDLAFNEKEGTIAILSTENMATKNALKRSQNKNLFFLLGLSMFALCTLFLYLLLRQRNKLNREITKRNIVISKNLEEKEYLIKEIHHRVKNNLQVISSLLSLQSRTVDDQSAIDALHESQSRVLSMSLIHQNLYKENNNSQIGIKSYLTNLCQNLFSTYNINKDQVQLHLDIEDMDIDVGSMVPLGLIVNELISNSLKYAFKDRANGVIGISCKQEENRLILKVWDDGIGQTPIENAEGFGYRLIQTFAKRLEAKISKSTDHGTSVELIIDNVKKAV